MSMKRIRKSITAGLCIAGVILAGSLRTSAAAPFLDPSKKAALTIEYTHEKQPLKEAEFKLYRVAAADKNGKLTRSGDFPKAKYPVDFPASRTEITDKKYQTLAQTLSGYVQKDAQLKAAFTGKTDKNGKLICPDLKPGLYLVMGTGLLQDGYRYQASPAMRFLPAYDAESREWKYEETMKPKYERDPAKEPVTCKVLKVWDDKGYDEKRPEEITMELLCDGKVQESVKLTKQDSWKGHTWENLDGSKEWTVVEKAIDGYTVKTEKKGVTFTITNTYGTSSKPPQDTTTKPSKVPQTGMLWWPVPVLVLAGLLLLAQGTMRNRRRRNDK